MCATIRDYTVITVHYINFILHSTVCSVHVHTCMNT